MNILRVTIVTFLDVASEIAVSSSDVTVHGLMARGKMRVASGKHGGMVHVDA
jgi:hypothetical protein